MTLGFSGQDGQFGILTARVAGAWSGIAFHTEFQRATSMLDFKQFVHFNKSVRIHNQIVNALGIPSPDPSSTVPPDTSTYLGGSSARLMCIRPPAVGSALLPLF